MPRQFSWIDQRLVRDGHIQGRSSHALALSFNQIGRELGIDPETVAKYAALASFPRRRATKRTSKLDPFKPLITRWLVRHPYSATQIYQCDERRRRARDA